MVGTIGNIPKSVNYGYNGGNVFLRAYNTKSLHNTGAVEPVKPVDKVVKRAADTVDFFYTQKREDTVTLSKSAEKSEKEPNVKTLTNEDFPEFKEELEGIQSDWEKHNAAYMAKAEKEEEEKENPFALKTETEKEEEENPFALKTKEEEEENPFALKTKAEKEEEENSFVLKTETEKEEEEEENPFALKTKEEKEKEEEENPFILKTKAEKEKEEELKNPFALKTKAEKEKEEELENPLFLKNKAEEEEEKPFIFKTEEQKAEILKSPFINQFNGKIYPDLEMLTKQYSKSFDFEINSTSTLVGYSRQ
ncbi:MAG: hypothetical protein LBM93_07715 [Oscillospiraceae bacterium]|jgi:hypothetical protein|nr:hypothetical protein [Oscillospiraceae bacterium]